MRKLSGICLLLIFLSGTGLAQVRGTRHLRCFNLPLPKSKLVELVGVGGEPIREGRKYAEFIADEDWPRDLVLEFKNVSRKPIEHFEISFIISQSGGLESFYGVPIHYGRVPRPRDLQDRGIIAERAVWLPNEVKKLSIEPSRLAQFLQDLKDHGADTDYAYLNYERVYFADGTGIVDGKPVCPDVAQNAWLPCKH